MSELERLRLLVATGSSSDRAFADGLLRMQHARSHDGVVRAELEQLHTVLRDAALSAHAGLRRDIASGILRGAALRACFEAVPLAERDHFVEEALGVAYPPLQEARLEKLVAYQPSGYDEIVHALDVTELASGQLFLDVGSGLGKASLLATLLTGATSSGIELDARLCEQARLAAQQLGLDAERLVCGDARRAELADADVTFMYIPFTGKALRSVMAKLTARARSGAGGRRYLCATALDLQQYPELVPVGPARSWLHVYAWRSAAAGATLRRP